MTPERDTPAEILRIAEIVAKCKIGPGANYHPDAVKFAAALIDVSARLDAIAALVKVERDEEAKKYVAEFGDMVSSGDTEQQAIVNVLRCADLQLRHELAAGKVLRDSLRSVSARLERARVAIQNQNCAPNCQSRSRVPFGEKARAEQDRRCTCWKAQALADIPAPAESSPVAVEGEKETLWRCNDQDFGLSKITTNRQLAVDGAELYGAILQSSIDGGKTWIDADVQASEAQPKPCWRCGGSGIAGDPTASNRSAAIPCPECDGNKVASEAPKGNE